MKSKKVLYPKVKAGGTAVPLGNNFYHMQGRKHDQGGIEIGNNDSTGIEVEGDEIMHITNKEAKVYSAVPFLNGKSPADHILDGANPTDVFKAQQQFKKDNNINDDGSKKKLGGKIMNRNKYKGGGPKKTNTNILGQLPASADINIGTGDMLAGEAIDNNLADDTVNFNPSTGKVPNRFNRTMSTIGSTIDGISNDVGEYFENNPGVAGDYIGVASNVLGAIGANKANNRMLDRMTYSAEPVGRTAAKLKTTININPQLDKMRETAASYERDVDNNTASSRVGLARKQRGRVASMMQTNELYGNKENIETELVNKDSLNQQSVNNANTEDYNRWAEGKASFNNAVAEKRSENTVGLIETLNAGVQDIITRGEKRNATRENMLTMAASHPNVNPRILKDLGVKSITDKMVADWDKANSRGKKKSNTK